MFTAQQYRAKAAEFRAFLTNIPRSPNETRECRDLEQSYTTLAENEEWNGDDSREKELRQPYCPCRGRRANFEVFGRGRA
jgi:hypothetical protein